MAEGAGVGAELEDALTEEEDGLGAPTDGTDMGTATEDDGLEVGPTTGGVRAGEEDDLVEVLTGAGLATTLEAPTRGGVHSGGAFVGRRVLGVCEN
jgi:hypothetical protein